jgi:hypothetical protein
MIDIFRPILFRNGVTNCYNAFAGLLVVVSLSNLPNILSPDPKVFR